MATYNGSLRYEAPSEAELCAISGSHRVVTSSEAKPWTISWFRYRAKQISTGLLVYWESSVADPTGAHSGYLTADLSDVVKLGSRP